MISKKTITLTAALIAIGSMTSSVLAADINMRLATMVKAPHPFIDMAAFFKKEVEAKSSGRIAVKIFPAASLGKDQAVIGEMKLGSVDLMISSTFGAVRQVPEFQVFSLPYLFSGLDSAMGKIAPGTAVHKYFEKIYADRNTGMKLLALGVSGTRNLSNAKRPVKGLSDIKGLKMRTPPSPMISQTWKTLGTLPVSISWPELYAGIQTGVAEGLESSIAGYKGSKLYEVAPHLALTAHMVQISHLSMSARTWKKLSAADKKIVLSMAASASDLGLSKTKGYEAAFVNTLQKNHGVKVTRPNISEFSSVLKPVQSKFATQMKVSEALRLLQ